jgi:mRNA interferase RelE/StbE
MATVKLTPGADEQMARLPKKARERVAKMLIRLEAWPTVSGTKALSGNLAGWHRARVGDYRVRFHVEGDIVIVDKIGHRKDVYEE